MLAAWITRRNQHDRLATARAAVDAFYDREPDAGPKGYVEAAALLGAAQLSRTIDRIDRGECSGGKFWQIYILTREATTATVVGAEGCPRCGLRRPLRDRTWRDLHARLSVHQVRA